MSTKKIVESGRVPGKGRIRASIEKLSRRLQKNGRINVSTKKWHNSSEYWEKVESVRISKNCLDAYQKMVEAVCVPKNGRIEASIEKIVSANNGKGSNECEYRKMVESRRVPGKGRIHASIEKVSGRVLKKGRLSVSTEKL